MNDGKNQIVRLGNPLLRLKSEAISEIEFGTSELKQLEQELFKIMQEENGLGLAAPQIGISKRAIVFGMEKHPIQIRLNTEHHLRYESAAARLGKPLATYLRECLETPENDHSVASLKREFLAMRHLLEDWTDKPTGGEIESSSNALLMEMVLLLRQLAKPEHVRIAQGELRRLGVLTE